MNEEQVAVVNHCDGPLLVAATAGSGKTTAVVQRIVALVAIGVEPDRILAVTFSVKAAKEMSLRLAALKCSGVRIATFHSTALGIVRSERPELAKWRIDDTDRYRICVKDAIGFRYMDWKQGDVTYLLSYIARCKAAGATVKPGDTHAMRIAKDMWKVRPSASRDPMLCRQAYEQAEMIRCERQLLTFDDMLLEAWALFEDDDGARQRWASRWDYVLQDEVQDENAVQHALAAQLARGHRNYMIVGDVAQSIYKFRGAEPATMLKFADEWKARVIRMNRNYRCARAIVDVANRCLDAMPAHTHLGVKMIAARDAEGEVRVAKYADFDAEGEGVTERILESHEDGIDWRNHVVLYRTNAQSRGVEEALLSARVPYQVIGGTNFYDRREVRDLLAYMRIAAGIGTFEDVRRSINTPFRFLGKAFVEGLEAEVGDGGATLIDNVREHVMTRANLQQRQQASAISWCSLMSTLAGTIAQGEASVTESRTTVAEQAALPSVLLEGLVRELRYTEWLTRDEGTESPENNRVSNVRELVRAAGRFTTIKELIAYVDETRARSERAKREHVHGDLVTLCSIHRAKGLEWHTVYVLGCNEKILPHAHAEDVDEERRLFYVACTRAEDVLELSYVQQAAVSNRVLELQPSRFLVEVGLVPSTEAAHVQA